jgi:hypothetical protein
VNVAPGANAALVTIRCRALSVGRIRGRIGTAGSSVLLSQFVYP